MHTPPAPSAARFDELGRFLVDDFAGAKPFAGFLPGIAGPLGVPLWAFYVNRGQAIASFGVESKDSPVLEFQPANKAYQSVAYTGFRTFVKVLTSGGPALYEPFGAYAPGARTQRMAIGAAEIELQETSAEYGVETRVRYFTLPGEPFAALVRQVSIANVSSAELRLELLDGLPVLIPYGVNNALLKDMSRTLEAWMGVFNLERGVPFYRVRAGVSDSAEVQRVHAGFFYLAFDHAEQRPLPVLVDPALVFGYNTSLSRPDRFCAQPLPELLQARQVDMGRTPCAFAALARTLAPGQSLALSAIVGYARDAHTLNAQAARLSSAAYLDGKRREATALVEQITARAATHSASATFDGYCRQNLLDNVLRGGWPLLLGDAQHPHVYHVYSRKHGDLERDYNAFYHAPEFYSQGNGNYRDVNQNRRSDVWLEPRVGTFDVDTFVDLIQADGYNPLVLHGSRFSLPAAQQRALLALAEDPDLLAPLLAQPFTPGGLLSAIHERGVRLNVAQDAFLARVLTVAEQRFEASYETGYWVDHWTYNLDLVESYLGVYPERKAELLHGRRRYTFYDSPAVVRPRREKYVLVDGRPRQSSAVALDAEKSALLAARSADRHLVRDAYGRGDVVRVTLFAKLVCLAALKFATLDPCGMGVEMEADRPGWYDALNGLPGLFGSSMPETFELERLLVFLLAAIDEHGAAGVGLPAETCELLRRAALLVDEQHQSADPERDYVYWDALASEREAYRAATRLGFAGRVETLPLDALAPILQGFLDKVRAGIRRALALGDGLPPTYFAYEATAFEPAAGAARDARDARGRACVRVTRFAPRALPLFLEGPARYMKIVRGRESARALYGRVKESALFDRALAMYKVNASIQGEPHDIGRARAFPPGWLENESIWLHMEYKYLLEVLRAGLYAEFFEDARRALVPFMDPAVYGRSPLENSSFLASSAHPDPALHGSGFVARLSGATAEFLSMWQRMMAGAQPFTVEDGQLRLRFAPALPAWLFDREGLLAFTFLGACTVTYHNPARLDTFAEGVRAQRVTLTFVEGGTLEIAGDTIGAPYAEQVRAGLVKAIDLLLGIQRG